jgi:predicted AAA+ superfamily ATPase
MENDIVLALKESNPWWLGEFKPGAYKHRDVYAQISKFLDMRQIIAFVGLRRTGKTTLMLKIVDDFLKRGLPAKNIMYFSFDDFADMDLREPISAYQRLLNLDIKNGKFLFLFDEVQKLESWQEKIKRIYDAYPDIKIIISGSESLFIRNKIRESLAGRMFEFNIRPLSFKEFIRFRGKDFENLKLYKEEILREFQFFAKTNGFPEIVAVDDEVIINKYIKENILDKVVYKDMSVLFGIRDLNVISSILRIIMNNPGQVLNLIGLSGELGISRQTLSLYLDYLEKAFLVRKLYNFSRNIRKSERSLKKYYPTIILPILLKDNFPKAFETMMVLQEDAEYFYRNPQKYEVDIIKIYENKILPIEVKTGKIEIKALNYFMKSFKVRQGIVLSYEQEVKLTEEITAIPFYKRLLLKE